MEDTLHYLLMVNHLSVQKQLFANLKATDLTLGQPKVLDYLSGHDGAVQKEIASACHIEPASLTSILNGMEKKGLIIRKMREDNRRYLYVYMTEKGREAAGLVNAAFEEIEHAALEGFSEEEKEMLLMFLTRIHTNFKDRKKDTND
ncbi:MAG: MarR family transcriptional regulator [Roseburia sp.]|nr:MarR family transcriptional regulator [Roseburia sp.]